MKKTKNTKSARPGVDVKAEYDFDYRKAHPNRLARRPCAMRTIIELDPDVAMVFSTSGTVNKALRALIGAVPRETR
jgi:hypothetical protein